MGLEDIVVEELVKPVGVAHLGLAEIGVACRFRVGESELTCDRIIRIDELIHRAVYARSARVGERGEAEPALLLHLTVDTHLLLRVTDVEIVVGRFEAVGELACIAYGGVTALTLLGSHDDHTGHGARAIYRGRGAIFEDLERFDIVGREASDSRGDKRVGVARREVVGSELDVIFENHTVNNPERLGVAVD